MMDGGERRRVKAGRVSHAGDGKRKEHATGFMVKSRNAMKHILLGTTSRGPRGSLWKPVERVQGVDRGYTVRRAGLNDMGPAAGSDMSSRRDGLWTKMVAVESRNGGAKGPVDGDGYRVSRFTELL